MNRENTDPTEFKGLLESIKEVAKQDISEGFQIDTENRLREEVYDLVVHLHRARKDEEQIEHDILQIVREEIQNSLDNLPTDMV
jgi:hypothetical protein